MDVCGWDWGLDFGAAGPSVNPLILRLFSGVGIRFFNLCDLFRY